MLQALFAFAVLCGGIAALKGSRSAIALLASTGFTMFLTWRGMPFSAPIWMAADVAAIVAIWRGNGGQADDLIVALYAPNWILYFLDSERASAASMLICSAQFLLSVPWVRAARFVRKKWKRQGGGDAPFAFVGSWDGG